MHVVTVRKPSESIEPGVFAFALSVSSVWLPQPLNGICKANQPQRSAVQTRFLPVLFLGLPTDLTLHHTRSCNLWHCKVE